MARKHPVGGQIYLRGVAQVARFLCPPRFELDAFSFVTMHPELFPLPTLVEEEPCSAGLSRGVRQRVPRRRAVIRRTNDAIFLELAERVRHHGTMLGFGLAGAVDGHPAHQDRDGAVSRCVAYSSSA